MDARELRCFVALAQTRSFGAAASSMSLTPSAVSRAIAKLEEDLGVGLFRRDAHRVELTEAGEALLPHARDALAALDQALAAAVQAGGDTLTGSLAVGVGAPLRHGIAPAAIERFGLSHPAAAIAVREQGGAAIVEDLLERRLDVGLALGPPIVEGLAYEPFGDAQLCVLLWRGHPLGGRAAVNLFELAGEVFLAPSLAAEPGLRERCAPLFAQAGFQPSYSERGIEHDEDMTALISGEGVMLVSGFFAGTLPRGVKSVALQPRPPLAFELVRRSERPGPLLERFIEIVRAVTRGG